MPFRRTKGILGDSTDPVKDADVIMTTAILGFTASYFEERQKPIRFDMDPLDGDPQNRCSGQAYSEFIYVIQKVQRTLRSYFQISNLAPLVNLVEAGYTPDYKKGGVIVGVGPGQSPPVDLTHPVFFEHCTNHGEKESPGKILYEAIRDLVVPHYAGRGAYTGFVDNPNGLPVTPLPTARFKVPAPGSLTPDPYPRWLPPGDSPLWNKRLRRRTVTSEGSDLDLDWWVPWGLIGGDSAKDPPSIKEPCHGEENCADQITFNMRLSGMRFVDEESGGLDSTHDIAAYTHGMIQAIYRGACLGEKGWVPYEIAVGDKTKKLASCIPCTLFMYAVGYPPTSIHLGRGESWAPLYAPYSYIHPYTGKQDTEEGKIIFTLNKKWYQKCFDWLTKGQAVLKMSNCIQPNHQESLSALGIHLAEHQDDCKLDGIPTVGGVLILDAITIHDSEQNRIDRTLKW